jgi:hypothetical protein
VAVSFGAYLFLHAQAQLLSYPGRVLSGDLIGVQTDKSVHCRFMRSAGRSRTGSRGSSPEWN